MDMIIKNATVVTGDGSAVIEQGVIFVEEGRIKDVLQGSDLKEGRTKQPALIVGCSGE